MIISMAEEKDAELVANIVHTTIKDIYPRYYPRGVVDFFLNWHSQEKIVDAIRNNEVLLFNVDAQIVATASVKENEIERFYVLPEFQGKGYGTEIMNLLEDRIFRKYSEIILEASLPAYSMYDKRGYVPYKFCKEIIDNGDIFCWHIMKLLRR